MFPIPLGLLVCHNLSVNFPWIKASQNQLQYQDTLSTDNCWQSRRTYFKIKPENHSQYGTKDLKILFDWMLWGCLSQKIELEELHLFGKL